MSMKNRISAPTIGMRRSTRTRVRATHKSTAATAAEAAAAPMVYSPVMVQDLVDDLPGEDGAQGDDHEEGDLLEGKTEQARRQGETRVVAPPPAIGDGRVPCHEQRHHHGRHPKQQPPPRVHMELPHQ